LLPVAPAGSAGAGAVPAAAGGFSASRVAGFFTTGISSYTVRASFCAASRAAGSVLTTATGTSPNARLSRSTSVSSSPGPTGRTPRSSVVCAPRQNERALASSSRSSTWASTSAQSPAAGSSSSSRSASL
jgi:hypothetical protein